MGIAAGMKDIVQDIVSSRNARVSEVKGLKKEANEMLGSFKASHKKMGTQLRRELADDKAKMGAEVKAMRRELADDKAKMGAEVKTMRSGFQSSRTEMSSVLKKDLAEHTQAVRGEGAKLRKNLAQGSAARKSEVHVMLDELQGARNQMGKQLRKELADNDREMRQETQADLREARTAWQELTRGVKKAAVKATPKVVRAEVEKAALKQEETPDLEAKLLAAIKEHPEGITLTKVAESLGVVPIVFGRVLRKLLGKGKIRKEDKAYFPAPAK